MAVIYLLVIIALAAGFRLRGAAGFEAWWDRTFPALAQFGGATTARVLTWAIPCGIAWLLLGGSVLASLGVAVMTWVGCLAPWFKSIDLGRREGEFWTDFKMHTIRGMMWVYPAAIIIQMDGGDGWIVALTGLTCAPVYELGYRIKETKGTEIGEALFGTCIALGLIGASL